MDHRAPLNAQVLSPRLHALGYADIEITSTTGSTNTDLCARTNLADGTVLLADQQTAGRGRMGRSWSAPAQSQIIASISWNCPEVPAQAIGLAPLVVGLSLVESLHHSTGIPAQLKWPNDILVHGRKLGGVLVEAPEIQPVLRLVAGFGVNYDLTEEELPVPHATSLALIAQGQPIPSREELTISMLRQLQENMRRFRTLGGAPHSFMPRYVEHCATLGQPVRISLPGESTLEGVAKAISPDGQLMVASQGRTVAVSAGDVIHVRADHSTDSTEEHGTTDHTADHSTEGDGAWPS